MKKNIIIYVGGFKLPDKNAAAQRVMSNGKIFTSLDYKVVYLGVNNELNDRKKVYKIQENTENNMFEEKYPSNYKEWFEYITSIKNIYSLVNNEYKDRVRAIVAYNYPAIALWKLRRYCKKNKIELFSDCTEWYSNNHGNYIFRIIKGCDTFLRMKLINPRLDGVICISEYLYKEYKNRTKTALLPPLVDLEDNKWNDYIKLDEEKNYIKLVYAGSPEIEKGENSKDRLDIIIKYLFMLKEKIDFRLNIVGINREDYLKVFESHKYILEELGERVVFKGRENHVNVIKLIRSSDFSIFTRNNNRVTRAGFPTKFVEAISSGIPVITNTSSDLKKYLIDGYNGFIVDIGNEKDTLIKLEKIFNMSNSQIKEMKTNCIKSRLFDYRKYIKDINDFL